MGKINAEELERVKGSAIRLKIRSTGWSEVLAQLKPEEGSTIHRRALQLFLEGKPEEALSELEEAKLAKARDLARSNQVAVAKELDRLARSYVLRGQILVSQLKFNEAEKRTKRLSLPLRKNPDAASELGFFLAQQNRIERATVEYERGLDLARKHGNPLAEVRRSSAASEIFTNLSEPAQAKRSLPYKGLLGFTRQSSIPVPISALA